MNLQTQIRQQQSTVQMLEKLLRAKRCSQADYDQAKRRLADLEQQGSFKPIVTEQAPPAQTIDVAPTPIGRRIEGDEYVSIQADLSKDADRLNRKMADLSNKLHLVPPTASCPELVKPILELKAQIEAIWDKKRYLERNHALPEESVEQPDEVSASSLDMPLLLDEATRFKWAYEKRRFIDQRSKLKRKLADPKASIAKRQEWETELAKADRMIQEIDLKLI